MAFSLNKVMLIGNLGRDAETRFTNNNMPVTKFSVATTYSFKNRDGEWNEETTWHNIVGFNLSDFYQGVLVKGAKVYVEGRLSKNDYTDKEGVKRYSTEVIIDKIIPLDSKESRQQLQQDNRMDSGPVDEKIPDMSDSSGDEDLPF